MHGPHTWPPLLLSILLLIPATLSAGDADQWTLSLPVPERADMSSVAIDPANPSIAYAATSGGVFKTVDRGAHWTLVDPFLDAVAVAINPRNPAMIVTGNFDPDYPRETRLRRSHDAGVTWQEHPPLNHHEQEVTRLLFDPSEPATVYAALRGSGVAKSADGGATWITSDGRNGLACCAWDFYDTTDLAIGGGSSPKIYAAALGGGLFSSADGAETWQPVPMPTTVPYPDVWNISVDPSDPERLYVGGYLFSNLGFLTSGDGGRTWEQLRLPRNPRGRVVVDPAVPTTLYAPTDLGVFRSTDRGVTWADFGNGLGPQAVSELAIDPTGTLLYAITKSGIYMYEFAPSSFERLPEDAERLQLLIRDIVTGGGIPNMRAPNAFILPAAGTVHGAQGQTFMTEVTLTNGRPVEQHVLLAWLAHGNARGAAVPMFRAILPRASNDTGGMLTISDVGSDLRVDGLGSILVIATDGNGEFDEAAEIDGFGRVWSPAGCGAGTMSQSLSAVSAAGFNAGGRARALGLRHDAAHRTNVGVVNLDDIARQFTVVAAGERQTERFTVSVPPFSVVQAGVPDGDYGRLTITVTTNGGSGPWTAYASSVNNASGDGWAVVAAPRRR